MILGLVLFEGQFYNIVTITFSALILTEFLNVYSEVNYIYLKLHVLHFYMIFS